MTKIAIIDLDGVCVNNDARFALAKRPDGVIDWTKAFDQTKIVLDVPIPGAAAALDFLESHGYDVYFMTSRPHYLREASIKWLKQHGFLPLSPLENDDTHRPLIFKDYVADRYVKTSVWKAREVANFAMSHAVHELLFVDDEAINREAVEALGYSVIRCKSSLADFRTPDEPLIF